MTDASSPSFSLGRRGLDLRFRRAVLANRTWETDAYVRVRLHGSDLVGFDSPGADDHLRLFFPAAPVTSLEELWQAPSREYTPFAWGEDWLEIEFAIHGEPGSRGIAAEWAATAETGAPVGVGGPRGSMSVEGAPDAWFFAGDETAVPAIRRFVAALPADAMGAVLLEVADPEHELSIISPAGVSVRYVYRKGERAGLALARRLDELTAAERPVGEVFAFVAAEQSVVRSGRALAVERWGLNPDRFVVKGYWKHGDVAFHAPH